VARDYDAIVVGGGLAACRRAEAGLLVCVLERGRRRAPKTSSTTRAAPPS
jgi:choline dehydrogenase-like flavoprotein